MKQYACYTFLGVGAYMTYFCMMASVNYWNMFYDLLFTTIASLVYNTADFVGVMVSPSMERKMSESSIIYLCFGLQFVSITLLIPIHSIKRAILKYFTAQIIIALCGAASGVFMSAINAIASVNGQSATHAVQFGVGVSEVFVEIIKLVFAGIQEYIPGSVESRQVIMQFSYFIAAQLYIVFEYYCWYRLGKLQKTQQNLLVEERSLEPVDEQIGTAEQYEDGPASPPMSTRQFVMRVLPSFFAIFINYIETYTIFPAVITAVPCKFTLQRSGSYRSEWWILINLSIYLFSDCLGRFAANSKLARRIITIKVAFVLAVIRSVFIVIFLLETLPKINIEDGVLKQGPFIFIDWIAVVVSSLFGLWGGLTVASVFMRQGSIYSDEQTRKRASNWVTIGISTACMIAGVISIPIADVVQYE